ncbi:hypothetical protein AMTRI_Chr13g123990 [Amborella trichopoda]
MTDEVLHVAVLSFSAFGHLIPFLELSKILAQKGHKVSFISTPRNIDRLPKIPPNLATLINLVKFELPPTHGLPENAEATMDLPIEKLQFLTAAYDKLHEPIENFVSEESPDWLIHDLFAPWAPCLAAKFGIPSCFCSVFTASTLVFFGPPDGLVGAHQRLTPESYAKAPEWVHFPSIVALRMHEAARVSQLGNKVEASGMSSHQRFAMTIEGCDFVAVRSCYEFEGKYLELLRELYGKPVLPFGLVPSPPVEKRGAGEGGNGNEYSRIFSWLDEKAKGSIVFVGFGTETRLSMDEVHEMAFGLELSGLPFVWLLKKPQEGCEGMDLLPQGFETRISNRGVVHVGWAPQAQLLAHPAIGGCLFHSGWGSVIEALQWGHTLILLVEKGIALEIERNKDGSFTKEAVAKGLRQAMVEEEGEPLRVKAREAEAIFADRGLHDRYMNDFIKYLQDHRRN